MPIKRDRMIDGMSTSNLPSIHLTSLIFTLPSITTIAMLIHTKHSRHACFDHSRVAYLNVVGLVLVHSARDCDKSMDRQCCMFLPKAQLEQEAHKTGLLHNHCDVSAQPLNTYLLSSLFFAFYRVRRIINSNRSHL